MAIADNYRRVTETINQACRAVGRNPEEVRLLPVTKGRSAAEIAQVIALGAGQVAENQVQEMSIKARELGATSWVFIGHLQRNKVPLACSVIAELQSLDSLRLAEALQRHLERIDSDRRLPVLVEVNTSGEVTKHGLASDQVLAFARSLKAYDRLEPRGLMTVAHPDPGLADLGFARLAALRSELWDRDGGGWAELSMGMSSDFDAAIAHGSTCVRIGTAIFGASF
ncbi:MAG: YggS family pyridoxal phosphate-dependent enzyme [Propionibacteriaceae bacterium]|nr:YggS family pyridoxal phosphate-dependent enzyme [Propionibacteriaceae bacterium]